MDVFDLYAKLSLDSKDYDRSLQNASSSADSFATKLAMTAKAVGGVVSGIGKGIASVVDKAVDSFASYEQNVGGVETLFKESSSKVLQFAENAYQTAGLSANQYMETVTSFSASLLQSLGNDTDKAADYADMAIRDMSDNANKMGTDMGAIQNAYQGFAKQNYTMLDNLKLGYGGTKTEMERLVKDAQKLDKTFKAQKDSSGNLALSYADIVKAIHIVQTEMQISGLTAEEAADLVAKGLLTEEEAFDRMGTTAKEASKTIEGSKKAMEASWNNMFTSLVTGGEFFEDSMKSVVQTTKTYAQNILPAIESAMHGFSTLVSEIVPVIAEELPSLAESILPDLISAVSDIIDGILSALPGLLTTLKGVAPLVSDALVDLVPDLVSFILEGIPTVIEAGITLLQSLGAGFARNIDTIIPDITQGLIDLVDRIGEIIDSNSLDLAGTATAMLSHLADALIDAVPSVLTQITQLVQDLTAKISDTANGDGADFLSIGTDILTRLVDGLMESIPTIIPELTSAVAEFISQFASLASSNTTEIVNSAISILKTLIDGISGSIPQVMGDITDAVLAIVEAIIDTLTNLDVETFIEGAVTLVTALADGIVQSVSKITEKLPDLILGLVEWLTNPQNLVGLADAATTIFVELVKDSASIIQSLAVGLGQIVEGIYKYFVDHGDEILNRLKEGFVNIGSKLGEAWEEQIKPAFTTIIENIKGVFTNFEWFQTVSAFLSSFVSSIETAWAEISDNATKFVQDIVDKVKSLPSELLTAGQEMIQGLVNGITQKWEELKGSVTSTLSQPLDWIKDKLGINSPSKAFFEIGQFIDEGFANGISAYSGLVENAMNDITQIPDMSTGMSISSTSGEGIGANGNVWNMGGIVINISNAEGMDEQALARMVANEVRDQVISIGATA